MVVLPPPLPPRITTVSPEGISMAKSLRTGRPSNFTHTSVNLITGASPEKDEHLGHEEVGHEDQDGGSDHRLGRRLADPHGPAGRVEAGVAADHAADEAEYVRFVKTLEQV